MGLENRPDELPSDRFIAGPPLRKHVGYRLSADGNLSPSVSIDLETLQTSRDEPSAESTRRRLEDVSLLNQAPEGLCIAIPSDLLQAVVRAFGEDHFKPESLQHAQRITALADDVGATGFWNGVPFTYPWLGQKDSQLTTDFLKQCLALQNAEAMDLAERFSNYLELINRRMQNYAGWLVSNVEFQKDQEVLLQKFTCVSNDRLPTFHECNRLSVRSDFEEACHVFFSKWIVDSLSAPGLPLPQGPMFPQSTNNSDLSIKLPLYFPTQGTGPIVEMIDDARLSPGRSLDHLNEWFELTGRDNVSHNKTLKLSRILIIWTYWRALVSQFPGAFYRRKSKLTQVFASFLKADDSTVKNDVNFLTKRLGYEWLATH